MRTLFSAFVFGMICGFAPQIFVFWYLFIGLVLMASISVLDSALSEFLKTSRIYTFPLQVAGVLFWPPIVVTCIQRRKTFGLGARFLLKKVRVKLGA